MASRRCQTEICENMHFTFWKSTRDSQALLRGFERQSVIAWISNILQQCHEAEKEIRQVGENAKNQRKSEGNSTNSSMNFTMRFDFICWTREFFMVELILYEKKKFLCAIHHWQNSLSDT